MADAGKSKAKGGKKAPKSFKADGTPKKRWSPAERAERGGGDGGLERREGLELPQDGEAERAALRGEGRLVRGRRRGFLARVSPGR